MKTFTNYAAKAKQFLNLLQGYTKGIRITAILILLLMGVSNAWGKTVNGPRIYFDNSSMNMTSTQVYFVVGHNSFSRTYGPMKAINDTKLLYRDISTETYYNWGDATYVGFIQVGSKWGDGSWGSSNLTNATNYTKANTSWNSFDWQNTYYCKATSKGGAVSIDYKSAGYNGIPKYDATQSAKVRNTTSGSYSTVTSGDWPATLKLTGTYLSGDGASKRTEISSTKSSDGNAKTVYGAVVTGKITHSYSDLSDDYQFDGWGTSTPKAEETYEYHITDNTTVYAFFTKKYAVNFGVHSSGGGTISAKSESTPLQTGNKIVGGSEIIFTASPSNGYQVEGWYSDANCTSKIEAAGTNTTYTLTALESTAYVYVKFKGVQYTVTLNQENATTTGTTSVTATYGVTMPTIATLPTLNGYDFAGYFDAKSGGTKYYNADGSSAKDWDKTAATTLYAQWTAKDITINWNANGGSVTPTSSTYTYDGDAITLPTPSYAGHRFLGWFTAADGGTQITDVGTTNKPYTTVTYYAHWEVSIVEHEVTFGVGTGYTSYGTLTAATSSGNISSGANIVEGTSVTFTATPQTGYVVEGWYTDAACAAGKHDAGQTTYTTSITGITNVYVKFVEKTWSVAFTAGTGGTVSPSGIQTVGQVTGIIINANHDNGYTFNKWTITSGNGTLTDANSASTTFKPTSDATVEASFNETLSTLTTSNKYDAGDPGYAAPSATVSEIGIATTATVTAAAAGNGYTFTGWTLTNCTRTDGGAADATSITVRSNGDGKAATVVANYAEDLTSEWHLVGNGNIFPDGWNVNNNSMMQKISGKSTEDVVAMKINVRTVQTYEFKIVDDNGSASDTWYGYSTGNTFLTWTTTGTKNVYSGDNNANNLKFTPNVAGVYEFKVDYSGKYPNVTITYPTSYTVTYSRTPEAAADAPTTSPSVTSGKSVVAGTSVTFTAKDAKTGYTWKGWYSNNAGSGTALSANQAYTTSITANTTIFAVYTANTYTVVFDANGGDDGTMSNQNFTYGTAQNLTANTFTRTGYTFAGWATSANGNKVYNDKQSVSNLSSTNGATVTLYAKWNPINYTITYKDQGDKEFSGTHDSGYPTQHTYNTTTTLLGATKDGYTFAGWYRDSECAGARVETLGVDVTEAITLYAKWDVASYTITFDQQSGSDGTPSVTAQYGAKLSAITIPSRDGYLFDGYYTQTGGKGTKYYNADGTTNETMPHNVSTLYANWIGYDHCIFFKNTLGTLGWKDIYVYTFKADSWYEYEDGETKYGPGVCPKVNAIEFGKMTQIGKTDIFYYVLTDLTGFNYIAFSNAAMNTYDEFYGNKAIYRGDRSDQLQLFIPNATGSTKVVNQTTYYNDGIWMKYNSKDSGYDWSGKTADSDWSDHSLLAEKKGDYSFTTTVSLTAGTNYEFKISNVGKDADNEKIKETAWYGWSGTMTQASCTNKHFKHNTSNNAKITPTVDGDYTFTVYLGDGKVMVSLEYPLSTDDYRLAYSDITLSKRHEGHYLKKRTTGEILDTVSFFVRKDKTPQILLQQCTKIVDGKPTWATVDNGTYNITVNADGVYNFVLKQTNSGNEHTRELDQTKTHLYSGDYYIRTDASEGGWKSYRQASNRMNYSTYADLHSEFNHYFCSYREKGCNVKFIVANDYSECLTDTMDNDDIIRPNQSSVGCLPENANVRFGWNSKTNELTRAYISGAGLVEDRFLVLMGNDYLKDAEGKALVEGTNGSPRYGLKANEEIFDDMGNWIYQVDVQACNQTTIRLSALYNGEEQLFKGAKNDMSLLNSTEPKYYKVRMIYDFKTNHMISAWLLDEQGNTIEGEGSLASDILVIRKNQDQANQLTFIGDAQRTDVGVVYGVMTFDKFFLNNIDQKGNAVAQKDEKTIFERALYWISFPFNVKLKDIFGFSNYGDHWILEEYNGEARAENGAWVDSESYWEYITDSEYELKAGKGYVLCLDLDKMGVNSDVFQHTNEVSLYFPSKEKLGTINGATTSITLDPYTCNIERDNRNIYDSNWHLIGVPRFADITTENINIIPQPTQENVGFYYEYGSNGEYTVKKSGATTFHTMSAYLVQYAGVINWTSTGITVPAAIAARKNSPAEPEQVHLRLEIAQDDEMADQTFVQLQQEGATAEFDMNLDLTKMLHSGTNIYTLAGEQGIKSAGNVMPMSECVVPVGVKVDTEGEYTFRMPDGTEGMVVELIDYYTNTRTNLLLFDYTVDLSAGTCNDRFALHIQPSKSGVTTNIDQINGGSMHHEGVQKYIIDGKLIIRTAEGEVFDAQGHRL